MQKNTTPRFVFEEREFLYSSQSFQRPILHKRGLAKPANLPMPVRSGRQFRSESLGQHESEELPLCVQEILQTLRKVKRPLSLTLLKEEMDRRGRSES